MTVRLLLAMLLPMLACVLQWLLWDYIKPYVWFLFFPAAFFSAWIGGLRGGLAGTLIGALLAWYVFIPPSFSFELNNPASAFSVVVFVAMGGLFAWFFERLRQAMRRTDEALRTAEEANRKITQLYEKTLELDTLKSQFFANVSHELRTPLTLLLAPLEQRLRRLSGSGFSETERHETELMLRNARLLYRHVSDLLDAAKFDAGRMPLNRARLDLTKLVRAMASHFESLAATCRIDYRVETPETLAAEVDGEKLQRILLNLLSNAFKFTPDGGMVALRLAEMDGNALIEVRDSGPGVPAELREAVFERFRQVEGDARRQHGGTGLGLAIVKDFVSLHGGTVALDEAPGGGALFTVRLPLVAPPGTVLSAASPELDEMLDRQALEELEIRPATAESEASSIEGDEPLVLVVEDNPDMNEFIAAVLRPHYRVARAYDGREGLERALALHPDLILSDVMMPAMSGDEMVAELRRRPGMESVPIVMLTARADEELRVRLLTQGVQDYLNKPFSVEELLARVEGLVVSRRRTLETLQRSAERLRRLAEFVERIAAVRDQTGLTTIVCQAVRELTGSDGVTFVLRDGEYCHYVDEDAAQSLWKGLRFPLEACISGWVMLHREPAVIEDIYTDPRIPYAAYRPTFVKSLAMLPIGRENPEGAIGCYWAERHQASAEEIELHQALADAASVGLSNLSLYRKMAAAQQAAEQSAVEARDSASALQAAQRLAGLGNWRWDISSDIHNWSEEIYLIYGRDPALPPAVYPEVQRYFTPESWTKLAVAVETAMKDGVPYEVDAEVVRPDGTQRWIIARGEATRDVAGEVVELHGTVQDITTRKNAEDALRVSEATYRSLFDNMLNGFAYCRMLFEDGKPSDFVYLSVNRAFESLTGLTEVTGRNVSEVIPGIRESDPEIFEIYGRVSQSGVPEHFERYVNALQMWFSVSAYSPKREHFVAIFEVVTERKQAEEEIHRLNADLERRVAERTAELSAANRELDSFAYAVSHDLRAPLRAMSGFSQALIEDYAGRFDGEAKNYLEQIDIASRRMGELIDGILVLSRSTRGELRRDEIDLSGMATRVLEELARDEPGREVNCRVEPGLRIMGDNRMIEAVVRNLLGNAWKYTAHAAQPQVRVYDDMRGDVKWVCVADNGAGFDMAHSNRLFQPFQRLHRQDEFPGIGIGLATVQRIVHRHGGAIEASGEPGKGAVFCLTLTGNPAPAVPAVEENV